jgi:hypothetical protein
MTVTVTKIFSVPAIGGNTPNEERVRRVHYMVNGISDGTTNLTDEVIFDPAWFTTMEGYPVGRIAIRRLGWSEDGFTSLNLSFDRQPDVVVAYMSGNDYKEFPAYLPDTGEGGDGTGKLLLTTVGAAAAATFSLEIEALVKGVKRANASVVPQE